MPTSRWAKPRNNRSLETRYAFVARRLAEQISAGEHPVGSVLPNEFALAEHFGVSRATVRSALRELQQLGLVSRRKNAGTRVEALRPTEETGRYNHSLATVDDVIQYAAETERRVQEIGEEVADGALAVRLGCQQGRRWLRISHLRVPRGEPKKPPISWTDVFVDARYADVVRSAVPTYKGLIGSLIEERAGRRIAEIRQKIRATGIPPRLAEPLVAEEDEHALEITRRYLDAAGDAFIVSISTHPADRFAYEMRLLRAATDEPLT